MSRHRRRKIHVLAARVSDAVNTRAAGFPVRKLFPIHWITDVPDKRAFFVGPLRIATPVGLLSLQGCHHEVIMELHLDRIGIVRALDKLYVLWVGRISHVQNRPASMPLVTHVEIPSIRYTANRHFERAATPVEITVTDRLHVTGLPTLWNRIGVSDTVCGKDGDEHCH